ncbi:aspartate/tyrosine/aromatic aminotransferase [Streptomyces sp. ISL-96]|uniref:amino acid aminotransferase n=1 Tax=Streptomyces sp. ISL-96 TaxID=2819191 RepID=UPI001BE8DEDA|nr:amino acid aminotransferase [Streptomyces sp. ISL-96]MBT2489883.1 aspartate/tyrosine/aromatic aminotransferase [Streptomyces sp. ISL-96]
MLELLSPPPTDPLFALVAELGAVARPERLDLLVGVYRDQTGTTPVMAAVREAELRLAERGASKEYRGLSGNQAFNRAMTSTVLGSEDLISRATAIQTVAGTGALNLLAEFVHRTAPGATVWISDPSYVNHRPILESAGLTVRTYRYLDADGRPDQAGLLRDLSEARRNDVVLIQGCCHNPTGVDLTPEAWDTLAGLAAHHGWVPFVDLAYHGLGDGLEADLEPTRTMASRVEEMLIAVSCSKNFGLYSERTGCAIVLGPSQRALRHVESTLQNVARVLYSMPPEHGAAIVTTILDDPGLYATWRTELDAMRTRINANRADLVAHLGSLGCDRPAEILAQQKGMFSMLPLTPDQMLRLREDFAVYGTGSGRINIAGISAHRIPYLANSIAAVATVGAVGAVTAG